jgi:pyrimidine operon attenuation protein/uracil phosphoribosyltransferase
VAPLFRLFLTGDRRPHRLAPDLTEELTRKAKILDADRIRRMVDRMAHEIAERQKDLPGLALIGIRTRGVPLATRLAARLSDLVKQSFPVGTLDITLYRDDLSTVAPQPLLKKTEIDFDLNGRTVLLCDDVLYTGRTIRAALDGVIDLGRPRAIRLAVLIDRGHREFPIEANYVGKSVPTASREVIQVMFQETDGADEVWILERPQ